MFLMIDIIANFLVRIKLEIVAKNKWEDGYEQV